MLENKLDILKIKQFLESLTVDHWVFQTEKVSQRENVSASVKNILSMKKSPSMTKSFSIKKFLSVSKSPSVKNFLCVFGMKMLLSTKKLSQHENRFFKGIKVFHYEKFSHWFFSFNSFFIRRFLIKWNRNFFIGVIHR